MILQLLATIDNLASLEILNCQENQLQQVPDNLRQKFGEAWCRKTLTAQRHPMPQTALLPGYAAARAQAQCATPPENTEEALTNNLAKLRLN